LSHTVNLGIVAHVDAGKTSLTERLLHTAGVIDRVGRVDHGDTQTDSLDLERQRGITIKSAVVSFTVDDVTVNLIDTPGHPDFIAEVERVLDVLDAAVLVVSGVEGVQAQTRVLAKALRRLGIPTLVFVNKMDRPNARRDLPLPPARSVHFGSAMTGAGIPELVSGIAKLAPPVADGPMSGTVFKIDRDRAGAKVAYVRMFAGTLKVRDRLPAGKVTGLEVFAGGTSVKRASVGAGQIAKVHGLDVRIGDHVGEPREHHRHFAPPTLETVVVPAVPAQRGEVHAALTQLAEQDPLINLRPDLALSLYGEVQKEVIQAVLANEFGVAVDFERTTAICVEHVVGTGSAVEFIAENPYLATVGLRVSPGERNAFQLGVELGSMPSAFFTAVEEAVLGTLEQGLYGWQVNGCVVTMTHSGYWARQSHAHATFDKSMSSTAGDFRALTPLVLMAALHQAGTRVHEPVHTFQLEIPEDLFGPMLSALGKFGAVPLDTDILGDTCVVHGDIPAAQVHPLRQRLPSLTRGEGALETVFSHHAPVTGAVPTRARTGPDPLNRKEYLLRVRR
jgi:ribosomal protection tetracycline resistance protein